MRWLGLISGNRGGDVFRRLGLAALAAGALAACGGQTALPGGAPAAAMASSSASPTPSGTVIAPSIPDAGAPPADSAAVQRELLARWNGAAGTVVSSFNFQWAMVDQFPHPTFKGGSAEAYQAFAAVLIAFLQQGDNFDFLARNHLFTIPLRYVFPSGQIGIDTTFLGLTTDLPTYTFAMLTDDTRQALAGFADRIQQALAR